jgi:hypothetical protein
MDLQKNKKTGKAKMDQRKSTWSGCFFFMDIAKRFILKRERFGDSDNHYHG